MPFLKIGFLIPQFRGKLNASVTSALFGFIKRDVGELDRLPKTVGVMRKVANADANRLFQNAVGRFEAELFNALSNFFRDVCTVTDVRIDQQDQELLAAEANDDVRFPDAFFQDMRRLFKNAVADVVTVFVVDLFEVVHIAHQEADLFFTSERTSNDLIGVILQEATVVKSR